MHPISIHAPHARSDSACRRSSSTSAYFNPRSSCEERLKFSIPRDLCQTDFNPRSSCEERRYSPCFSTLSTRISIHAPHARSDDFLDVTILFCFGISIHAPHARSDTKRTDNTSDMSRFQSTLLMRGATVCLYKRRQEKTISIHAPHARSDTSV